MEFVNTFPSLTKTIRQILRSVTSSLVTDAESSSIERRLSDGSKLMGEYNFRTSRMDSKSDPIGWYEDDL